MNYLFAPRPITSIAIKDEILTFPINRIFCVGRNYQAHAKEMGMEVDKSTNEPFFFMKDATTVVSSGGHVNYPLGTENYHYEIELAIAFGKSGHNVAAENAESLIYGYMPALDMTRRDLQAKAKKAGLPWDFAKNFEQAAVFAPIIKKEKLVGDITANNISLCLNGEKRQSAILSDMIWSIPELIAYLSKFYHLQAGDILLTGTPEGVSAVRSGDVITGAIDNIGVIELNIN